MGRVPLRGEAKQFERPPAQVVQHGKVSGGRRILAARELHTHGLDLAQSGAEERQELGR